MSSATLPPNPDFLRAAGSLDVIPAAAPSWQRTLPSTTIRILVVAETEAQFEALRTLCTSGNPQVGTVHWLATLKAAREAALSHAYDLVIAAREESGLMLLRELARDGADTPVIVLDDGDHSTRNAAGLTCAFLNREELDRSSLQEAMRDALQRASVERARRRSAEWWRSAGTGLARALRQQQSGGALASEAVATVRHEASGTFSARSDVVPFPGPLLSTPAGLRTPGFKSDELLGALLGRLPVIAARIDDDGTIVACSGAGLRGLGLTAAHLQGRNLFHAEGVPTAAIRQALRGTPVSFVRSISLDGQTRHFECHVRFDQERGHGAVGYALDVTDRVQSERTHARREQFLTGLLRHLPTAVGRIDGEGRVSEIEGEGLHGLGLDPARLIGVPLGDAFPAGRASIARSLRGEATAFEARVDHELTADGEGCIHVSLTPSADDAGGAVFVVHDITARRQLERELLQAVDHERQRIGADLHDEVGQLLTGIACLSKALAQRLEGTDTVGAGDATAIADVATQALNHTRSLARGLAATRIAAAGLDGALRDLQAHVQRMHAVPVVLDLPSAKALTYGADTAGHLFRIVQEAVANGLRHGAASRVTVQLRTAGPGRHVLTIQDNGRGFDPREPGLSAGSGLGLMRHRATLIGGRLDAFSAPGAGTRISVTYPIPGICPYEEAR